MNNESHDNASVSPSPFISCFPKMRVIHFGNQTGDRIMIRIGNTTRSVSNLMAMTIINLIKSGKSSIPLLAFWAGDFSVVDALASSSLAASPLIASRVTIDE